MKIQSIKGMNDLLPSQTKNWRQVENLLHNFLTIHGYDEIRTPIVEKSESQSSPRFPVYLSTLII